MGRGKSEKRKPYAYQVSEIINGLRIIKHTMIKVNKGKYEIKAYEVQSVEFPLAPTYIVRETDLNDGKGDAYTTRRRIFEGNSLYNEVQYRKYLTDIEQAKTIAPYHNAEILLKCPCCQKTKKMKPSKLLTYGFSCPKCSSGISYGELAFQSYQEYFKLNYLSEQSLKTLDGRRVDFVVFDNQDNIINFVEIQGSQHTDKNDPWYEDAHAQDVAKRKWAKENNVLMIEIDMRISSWEYFKEQINNCEYLPSVNNDDEKAILKIMEKNKRHPVEEIVYLYTKKNESCKTIGERYGMNYMVIYRVLKKFNIETKPKTKNVPEKEVVELYVKNMMSTIKIADHFNVSSTLISKILKRNGVTMRK